MTRNALKSRGGPIQEPPSDPARKSILILALLVGVIVIGAIIMLRKGQDPNASTGSESTATSSQGKGSSSLSGANRVFAAPRPPPVAVSDTPPPPIATAPAPPPPPIMAPRPEPSAHDRQLVNNLTQLDLSSKQVTPEMAAAFRQNLQALVQRGADAVPAIREFLEKNKDVRFDKLEGGAQLGFSSMRMAMIDAMAAIGGPAGIEGSLAALQSNASPAEIARLARNLEGLAPEQYRQAAVDAARSALALAATGKTDGQDVGELFRILQQYGGQSAIGDLERYSSNWRYYSTIALANLPEGAGIPALIQMVQDPNSASRGARVPAMQALAQVAPTSPDAARVLVEQAKAGAILPATWITIASVLGGHQFEIGSMSAETSPEAGAANLKSWHLTAGNQNFYSTVNQVALTQEQVSQRLTLIDQLLQANNNDFARQQLQDARTRLLNPPRPPGQTTPGN